MHHRLARSLSAVCAAALLTLSASAAVAAPDAAQARELAKGVAPANGTPGTLNWYLRQSPFPPYPAVEVVEEFGDYETFPLVCDADGTGDFPALSVSGYWYMPGNAEDPFRFGRADDFPLCGDWDGDGIDTAAVRRGNTFYFAKANRTGTTATSQQLGRVDDWPVVGDWNDDGVDSIGVVRGNTFHLSDVRPGSGAAKVARSVAYGSATDMPVVGDWDGDGHTTLGVVRDNVWYLSDSTGTSAQTFIMLDFGRATDWPVAGDWNADGIESPGVVRVNG